MQSADTISPAAIAYFSGSGHTTRLARAVACGMDGARLVDVERMTRTDWEALDAAPAIVFGAPTYMGSVAARYALFIEEASDARWTQLAWKDKIAAGFTVGTYPSGDKLSTLIRLSIFAAQMGMIWVGAAEIGAPVDPARPGIDRDGSMLGLMARSDPDKSRMIAEDDLETARLFGMRVQAAARRWSQ